MVLTCHGVIDCAQAAATKRIGKVRVSVAIPHEIASTNFRRWAFATFAIAIIVPMALTRRDVSRSAWAAIAESICQVRVLVAVGHKIARASRWRGRRRSGAIATLALAMNVPMVLTCRDVIRCA